MGHSKVGLSAESLVTEDGVFLNSVLCGLPVKQMIRR